MVETVESTDLQAPAPSRPDGTKGPADPMGDLGDLVGRVRDLTRANERLFARLVEGERRFRTLAKAVVRVQEEEQRRLARALEDGLGQTLAVLAHQLERLGERRDPALQAELAPRLAASVDLARRALAESRELSRLLRPPVLDDLGLAAALSWLARNLEQRTGLQVELVLELGEDRLDPDVETLVFRLVQEALTNVLKHAGVARAAVALKRQGEALELRVADAGWGFDPAAVFSTGAVGAVGSGLRGLCDRLDLCGGRLELASAPGQGTLLRAVVPLV